MGTTMRKQGPPRLLINHRDVAPLFGISVRTWRRMMDAGRVPLPHQVLGSLLLYDRAVIYERLDTGTWPAGVRFRGHDEDDPGPSADGG